MLKFKLPNLVAKIPAASRLLENQERDSADRVEPTAGEDGESDRRRRDGASEGRSGKGVAKEKGYTVWKRIYGPPKFGGTEGRIRRTRCVCFGDLSGAMAQAPHRLPESAVRRRGSEGTHEGAGRRGYLGSTRFLPRVTTPRKCGVGNPDILRVDGSSLSSRVPFTVRTMSVPYHARKEYRHCRIPVDHSLLAGISCNDTSTNARTMRNES